MNLVPRLRRWLHCLLRFHRPVTTWCKHDGLWIGCECGKKFYHNACCEMLMKAFMDAAFVATMTDSSAPITPERCKEEQRDPAC